ncbi:hypothetical protein JOB18_013376 [Solea senegalensis]|uniref:SHSP domain-containing protein n=1 Tax=Solea senegalensis TaxID=28829 RepID=A0AAV6R1X8_SOLSE|nr:hypothetical protein JOB18_013376 [Solea senegalensis]
MGEQNKILPRPIFRRDASWEPFPNWTQPSRVFSQDFGLPPFLEPGDVDWITWAKKRLGNFSWPTYTQTSLLPPVSGQQTVEVDGKGLRQLTGGVSEIRTGQDSWKINLDVNHFSPEEITITTKEGYLQISGNHEERQDQHGMVSRCFSRKYKAWTCSTSVRPCRVMEFCPWRLPSPGHTSSTRPMSWSYLCRPNRGSRRVRSEPREQNLTLNSRCSCAWNKL